MTLTNAHKLSFISVSVTFTSSYFYCLEPSHIVCLPKLMSGSYFMNLVQVGLLYSTEKRFFDFNVSPFFKPVQCSASSIDADVAVFCNAFNRIPTFTNAVFSAYQKTVHSKISRLHIFIKNTVRQ